MGAGDRRFDVVRRAAFALAALAVVSITLAARADAYVYWTHLDTESIGRANPDGTGVNPNFIPAGSAFPGGVAVDSTYIYWVNADAQTIGRANLDGTGINQSFIATDLAPIDVAVDGQHIYWSNSYENTIGRANVDGSGVNQSFITNSAGIVGQPEGVAVDGAHIYWANNQSSQAGESQTIGRANLDGSDVNQNFITGANTPAGVAVGPADIFWSNTAPLVGSIGHATINGGDVNQSLRFITAGLPIPVFPALPSGVAVQGSYVYWANFGSTTIGRANLDGTGAEGSFIAASTTVSSNVDVAADALVATCAGTEATIVGTGRPDQLSATNGDDVIAAGNGNDTGAAGGGTDLVCGGEGADRVSGGAGGDTVSGGAGSDTVSGGPGNDTINARDGAADSINCGTGTDTVRLDPEDTVSGASATNPTGSCESVGAVG